MLNWKSNGRKRPWIILKYYSLLSCSEEKLWKPTRTASVWPTIQSQLWYYFFIHCSSTQVWASVTEVLNFATQMSFTLGLLHPSPHKPSSTPGTSQVGPTAGLNAATRRNHSATAKNRALAKPATSSFTNDTHNVSFFFYIMLKQAHDLWKCGLWWAHCPTTGWKTNVGHS
jgi:hypothetical protein